MRHKKAQKFNNHDIVQLPEKKEMEVAIMLSQSQRKVYDMLFTIARTKYDAYKKAGLLSSCYLTVNSFMMPLRMCCSGGEFEVAEIQEKLDKVQSGVGLPKPSIAQAMGVGLQKFAVTEEEAFNANEECPICLELVEEPLQTPCRHVFCGDCIKPHIISQGGRCPICRKSTKLKDLKIPKGLEKQEPVKKDNIKKAPAGSLQRVIFDAKLKVLISNLEAIKKEKPKEKALVFTTWSTTMKWLQKELPKRGFKIRTITGGMTMVARRRALEAFQSDPPTTIFLLSVRSGAVGITLTAAQHVFMLEPCVNLALYRQAVNRVYRLGQTSNVIVKTLYMKNTIEEGILKVNREKVATDYSAGNINADKAPLREAQLEMLLHRY